MKVWTRLRPHATVGLLEWLLRVDRVNEVTIDGHVIDGRRVRSVTFWGDGYVETDVVEGPPPRAAES